MKRIVALTAIAIALVASPARAQYSVKLSWTASSDAAANPSLTYNVYRAATCAGHFSMINAAPVTGTSYVDTTAALGAAYCYQVTAVLGGVESEASNRTIAALPPPAERRATCEHRGPVIGWIRCLGARPRPPVQQSPSR